MNNYDEAYEIIVNMAKTKMIMNAHKGRIENIYPEEIPALCRGEVDELEEALKEGKVLGVIEEAGDILNFAVAAVQQVLDTYRGRKNGQSA